MSNMIDISFSATCPLCGYENVHIRRMSDDDARFFSRCSESDGCGKLFALELTVKVETFSLIEVQVLPGSSGH